MDQCPGPDRSRVLQRAQLMWSAGEAVVGTSGSTCDHHPVHGGGSETVLTPFAGAVPTAGLGCVTVMMKQGEVFLYQNLTNEGQHRTQTSEIFLGYFSCELQLGFIL